jgi:hypothetical protein
MVVGFLGFLISIIAVFVSSERMNRGRMLLALSLLVIHLSTSVAFYYYVQSNPADANVYYMDKLRFSTANFALGTVFTGKLTQFLKNTLSASFLECFIFFQAFGFLGVMFLMRTFREIHLKLGVPETTFPRYLLFLPSIQFWTSAIGKDAPLFFALSLCVWCVLDLRKRLLSLGVALLIMVLFRAHIALLVLISLAVAAAVQGKISLGRKSGLLVLALIGAYFVVGSVNNSIRFNITDINSITTFLQLREEDASKIVGSGLGSVPFYLRFVALLFRPFFFDADDILGIIASLENVGSIMLFGYLLKNFRLVNLLGRRIYFISFCIFVVIFCSAVLATISYNVGLGLRERVMIFPPILSLFVTLWAMPRRSSLIVRRANGGGPVASTSVDGILVEARR